MLMTVCRRYIRDPESCKDVLQESLIKIFKHIDTYKNTGSFEGWMRKITLRCALAHLNRKDVRREVSITDMNYEDTVQPLALNHLHTEEIIKLVQCLPDGFRTVFNLNVIEEFSHKEIAETLGISESASRSQLTRARKLLQKLYLQQNNLQNRQTA